MSKLVTIKNGILQEVGDASEGVGAGSVPTQFGYHLQFGDDALTNQEIGRIIGATLEAPILVEIFLVQLIPFDGDPAMVKVMTADLDGSNPVEVLCIMNGFECEAPHGGNILTSDRKFMLTYMPADTGTDDVLSDGETINTNTHLISVSADFTVDDVGRAVSGAGIPNGTTILSRVSATEVIMSAAATATASDVAVTIHERNQPSKGDIYIIIRYGTFGLVS